MNTTGAALGIWCVLTALCSLASAQGEPCTVDAAGTTGDCRFLRSCPALDKLATDLLSGRAPPKAVQLLRERASKCPAPGGWPMVCCQNELTRPPVTRPPVTRPSVIRPSVSRPPVTGRSAGSSCTPLPPDTECGRQFGVRIVGGENATIGEFPWMASIQYDEGRGGALTHGCGGTLITSRHILTAAHCVSFLQPNVRPVSVVLGELNFDSEIDCDPEFPENCADPPIQVDIDRIFFHPDYRMSSRLGLPNDIAVLRLAREVVFTDFVRPICLLNDTDVLRFGTTDLTPGVPATVAGWGKAEIGGGENFTPVLQMATVPIQPIGDCESFYSVAAGLDRRICAGAGSDSADTCRGDSGGPLMLSHQGRGSRWYQAGVTSFGSEQCGQVAGYTRVLPYFDWIMEQLCKPQL